MIGFPVRLRMLIDQYHEGRYKDFAKKIGVSPNTIYIMLRGEHSDPHLSTLVKIIDACPDASITWLITGQGEMIKRSNSAVQELERKIAELSRKLDKISNLST